MSRRYQHDELEGKLATVYGKGLEEFWDEIDAELVVHFKQRGEGA
jgi:hypothetical protein